jgi:hypothetical protein
VETKTIPSICLAINWVNFPEGSERRQLQNVASESWHLVQLQNPEILFLSVGDEHDIRSAPSFMEKSTPLVRNARSVIRHEKNLPFLRDILTRMLEICPKYPTLSWFGYLNSDIILKQDFFHRLMQLEDAGYSSVISRADEISIVNQLEEAYRSTPFRLSASGRDLYLFQRKGAEKLLEQLPDYLIGEPAWDLDAYRILMHETKMHDDVDSSSLTIHMNHQREWRAKPSIGRTYNEILYCCRYRLNAVNQDGFYSKHINR